MATVACWSGASSASAASKEEEGGGEEGGEEETPPPEERREVHRDVGRCAAEENSRWERIPQGLAHA